MIRQALKKIGSYYSWSIYLAVCFFYVLTMLGIWIFRDVDAPLKIACSVFMAVYVVPDIVSDVRSLVQKRKDTAQAANTTG